MKKIIILAAVVILAVFLFYLSRSAVVSKSGQTAAPLTSEISLTITPSTIQQGDPAEIAVENAGTSTIESLTYRGRPLNIFTYNGKPTALVGIDLKSKTGSYPVVLTLSNGRTIKKILVVGKRTIATAPLSIPEKLGGNTPQAEKTLLSTLAEENAAINSVPSESKMLWSGKFRFPLDGEVVVTDPYGYTRLTVNSTISHKGTDFRAAVGTPVFAMNSGKVSLVREFRNYGKTVIIDHGFGLQTLYMHLSETAVIEGEGVEKGEVIGKSGATGYAEFPHLHISIKINGISIDPMKFMSLFN